MKKIALIAILLLALVQANFAQKIPPLTNEAIKEYKNKNFEKARTLIDQSIISVEGKENAYTWHLRGHVYKYFFNLSLDEEVDEQNRNTAIESFKKSMAFDSKGTFKEANNDGLKPLVNSFWNDAVVIINSRDRATIAKAEHYLKRFIESRESIKSNDNINQYLIDFYKAFASANRKLMEAERDQGSDIEKYREEYDRVVESYKKVLNINSEEYTANYNLSINIYNEGAYQIEQMPAEPDLITIMGRQKEAVILFEKALPYALKADNIRPGRIETIKALRAIYLALNDYFKFDYYDQMVKKLKNGSGAAGSIGKEKFEQMRRDKESYKRLQKFDEE